MSPAGLGERIADLAYAGGWRIVRALPERLAARVFDAGADRAARRGGPAQLRANLARVIGAEGPDGVPDSLVRASMRSYARYWREAFRLPAMDLDATAAAIDSAVHGQDLLTRALARGRGVVLALPHSGNWDMAGVWLTRHHGTFTTVAERLRPESLYLRFLRYREGLGFRVLPLTGGTPPMAELAEALRRGEVVCLLGERDLRARGVEVDFFGERTRMPAGPAKLAIDTGATLIAVHCWFEDDGWGFGLTDEIDVSGGVGPATQHLADAFARNIARYPADWHMLQPLWLADLPEEHLTRIRDEGSSDAGGHRTEGTP